ncbi:hypothetical protein CVT26_004514 [Gymnopilus dilepis]|uniref:Uncharacterized protein n=1 Tax=Gymnopilus dilepis TaxID=231916 RepID=A0A409WF22_9AGAR|nr:hypothetical protein CVT26_004514 [Gymnopilus dilepis]
MFAARFVLLFLVFTGLAAYASPIEIENRADGSNVLDIVSALQVSDSRILAQLNSLASAGQANVANITPLIDDLVGTLNTASTSFNTLGPVDDSKGPSKQDVANAFAPIIREIALTLTAVENLVPGLAPLLPTLGMDAALHQALLGLDIVLPGVVELVAALLFDVCGILRKLGFTLTVLLLGF